MTITAQNTEEVLLKNPFKNPLKKSFPFKQSSSSTRGKIQISALQQGGKFKFQPYFEMKDLIRVNNLKFRLPNVTKSHYFNNLNSQLWIYAERGAAKTTPGLNPGLFGPEEGECCGCSSSAGPSFGLV